MAGRVVVHPEPLRRRVRRSARVARRHRQRVLPVGELARLVHAELAAGRGRARHRPRVPAGRQPRARVVDVRWSDAVDRQQHRLHAAARIRAEYESCFSPGVPPTRDAADDRRCRAACSHPTTACVWKCATLTARPAEVESGQLDCPHRAPAHRCCAWYGDPAGHQRAELHLRLIPRARAREVGLAVRERRRAHRDVPGGAVARRALRPDREPGEARTRPGDHAECRPSRPAAAPCRRAPT